MGKRPDHSILTFWRGLMVDRINLHLTLILLVTSAFACSLRYDFVECSQPVDCVPYEASGEFLTCSSNRCVKWSIECRVDQDCGPPTKDLVCRSNSCISAAPEVTDMGRDLGVDLSDVADLGPADMAMDADAAESEEMSSVCLSNGSCGTDEICVDGHCILGTSAECTRIIMPSGDPENYVFIGSILPTSPPYDNIGPPLEKAIELAVADFNTAQGLPGGRKIVWVSCNDSGRSDDAQRAADHLINTVGAPAIIGPLFSAAFIDVNSNLATPAGVFTITPAASAPTISQLQDNGLAWRTIPSDVYQGNAIVDRVKDLGVAKVSILVKNDAYGTGLFEEMAQQLTAHLGNENFYFANYKDPASFDPAFDANQISSEFAQVITAALNPSDGLPDAELLILCGTTESLSLAGGYLGALQMAGAPPSSYPRLLFSHGGVPDLPQFIEQSPALVDLVEGTSPNIFHPANQDVYTLRYNLRYGGQDPITISTTIYDAALVVLFAMSTVPPEESITGNKIAQGMSKLVDKTAEIVSFGDSDFISAGRNMLSNGESVDLLGVSGDLDFDLATGDVRSNMIGWGVKPEMGTTNYQLDLQRLYLLNPCDSMGCPTEGSWQAVP
jgi:ABC-type branched-subunit amino acid transport system substrate-binding protein